MEKLNLQQLLLQTSESHDPSEIILICRFGAQETFLIIIIFKSSCAAKYFCGNCDRLPFKWLGHKNNKLITFIQQRHIKMYHSLE